MARAIQDSINGIIVMSLVSMMNQFELSEQDAAGERPELEKLEAQDNRKRPVVAGPLTRQRRQQAHSGSGRTRPRNPSEVRDFLYPDDSIFGASTPGRIGSATAGVSAQMRL